MLQDVLEMLLEERIDLEKSLDLLRFGIFLVIKITCKLPFKVAFKISEKLFNLQYLHIPFIIHHLMSFCLGRYCFNWTAVIVEGIDH